MLKVLLIFIISLPAWAHWTLKRDYGKTSIFTSKHLSRLTINYGTTVPRNKNMNLDLAKYVENQKSKMLKFINISEWKVTDRKHEKRKDYTMIMISGTYKNPKKELIYFTEFHYYKSDRRLQALLTHTIKSELDKDNKESLLQGFKTKYGI